MKLGRIWHLLTGRQALDFIWGSWWEGWVMLLLMFFTGTWTSVGPFCGFSISLGQCNKRENLKRESLKGTLDSMGLTRSCKTLKKLDCFVLWICWFCFLLLPVATGQSAILGRWADSVSHLHSTPLGLGLGIFSFCSFLPCTVQLRVFLPETEIMQNILAVLSRLLALETPFPSASPSQVMCAAKLGAGKGRERKRKSFTPPFQPEAGA